MMKRSFYEIKTTTDFYDSRKIWLEIIKRKILIICSSAYEKLGKTIILDLFVFVLHQIKHNEQSVIKLFVQ